MRLVQSLRSLTSGLGAAVLVLALCAAVTAPGQACEKNKSTTVASFSNTKSSCSSTAAVSADCPASAHCPASKCRSAATTTASLASTKGSCPHTAVASGACKRAAPARSAVASRKQAARAKAVPKRLAGTTAATTPGTAGLVAVIDPVTGGVGTPTPEQMRELAAASKAAGVASQGARPDEPEIVRLADGTLVMQLPERLMMNAMARRDKNGKIILDCKHQPAAPSTSAPAQPAPGNWEEK